MVKLHSNGSFSLDNLQNKSLICLDSHMKYITFEHLWNTPQLSFLFVLKQKNQQGNLQGFGQGFQHGVKQFKHKFQVVIQL